MRRSSAYLTLFAGLLLVSTAAPFIKEAQLNAYSVAFWRLAGSSVLFAVWAIATGQRRIERRHLPAMLLGGALVAAHFAIWIRAFDLTNYASNLLLLVVQPIMAAIAGMRTGEPPTRKTWLSVALAAIGLAVIARGDFALGPRAILGDLLSIAANIGITSFYVITRQARATTPLPSFMAVCMGAGAIAILPLVLLAHAPFTGFAAPSWAWLAALVVITTLAGHGTMNFVARHVPLFTLNVVIVLEPAISIVMGIPLFGAEITRIQIAGGLILAVAVVIGLHHEEPRHETVAQPAIDA